MSTQYRPGTGAAVVTESLVVLLGGPAVTEVAVRLFHAGRPVGSLTEWAGRWAGEVTDLVAVARRGASWQVLVRGAAVAEVDGTVVRAERGSSEQVLAGAGFSIGLDAGSAGVENPTADDRDGDGDAWLPVTGGVVRACAVRAGTATASAGPDVEDTWHDDGDVVGSLARTADGVDAVTPSTPATPATPDTPATPPSPRTPPSADSPETVPVMPEPVFEVVLSSGRRVPVAGPVLVGRAPESGRFHAGAAPRLLVVANPERDISATHLELRPAADHVVATDMDSTNGTVVHLPGRPPARLRPGAGMPVPPGGVIELSADVRLTVVRIDPAHRPADTWA